MILYEESQRTQRRNLPSSSSSQNPVNHNQNVFDPSNKGQGTSEYGIVVSNQICEGDPEDSVKIENYGIGHQLNTAGQSQAMKTIQLGDSATKMKIPRGKTPVLPMEATCNGYRLENEQVKPLMNEMKSSNRLSVGDELIQVDDVEGCGVVWKDLYTPTSCKRHLLNQTDREFQSKRSRSLLTV